VRVAVSELSPDEDANTDAALLAEGFATLTPLAPICERNDVPLFDLASVTALG
jgi:hypothetical protein